MQTDHPNTTWINEYVLDGGTADRAATMFDALVEHWTTCRLGTRLPPVTSGETRTSTARASTTCSAAAFGEGAYSLGIARDQNVVVLFEVTGYIDRPHILRAAMDHAITEQRSPVTRAGQGALRGTRRTGWVASIEDIRMLGCQFWDLCSSGDCRLAPSETGASVRPRPFAGFFVSGASTPSQATSERRD